MKTIIPPGMGADATMYPKSAYKNLPGVIFADWSPYNGEKSIADVAKSVITYYHFNNKMVVGGSSLGGMVAIEIAKLIKINKVILS